MRLQLVVVKGSDWAESLPVLCSEAELHRRLQYSLVKTINDDARRSTHRHRESFDSEVDVLLWRLLE